MRDLGKNGRIVGGSIKFKGRDLTNMGEEELRQLRGSEIAMIYQEPMASLNPAMKVGAQLAEVPMIHQGMSKDDAWKLARQIVADVRLPDPDRIINAYPHQLSGGQQQRIVIAMALMSKPALPHPRRTHHRARCDGRGRDRRSGQGTGHEIPAPRCCSSATTSASCWMSATGSA